MKQATISTNSRTPAIVIGTSLVCAAIFAAVPASADAALRVAASIKPVHSLVASVMEGVGEPGLILEAAASPHLTSLKPSQAAILQDADLVFWIGPELETFLAKSISVIGSGARAVALADADGVIRLKFRTGGDFAQHHHSDENHGDSERHENAGGHEDHAEHDKHGEREDHAEHGLDTHIWLDPENAKVFVRAINAALADADPQNAQRYSENARRMLDELNRLTSEVETILEPVAGRSFIAFHDAYQHFEMRFGVRAAGTVAVNPDVRPGAANIAEIRRTIGRLGATCVFSEPQFENRLVTVIVEGTGARAGVLDPLGAELDAGPGLYPELIRALARSMRACLGGMG